MDACCLPRFGQLVIGPPGSGKSTYCKIMKQFMATMGRQVAVVNLDPANDLLPYESAVDVSDLITVSDAMDNLSLGPNGGLMYCMEYIEKNFEWLKTALNSLDANTYILLDCPGQVELYTHHKSIQRICSMLAKDMDMRLVAVHLVDSQYCTEPSKFISVLLTSLSTMLQIELPQINVLSKVDLIEQYSKLDFNIDFYTEVLDLEQLLETFQDDAFHAKFKALHEKIVGIVEDYSLVSFVPLSIKEEKTMGSVMTMADKANGYIYGKAEDDAMRKLFSSEAGFEWDKISIVREKYMNLDNAESFSIDNS